VGGVSHPPGKKPSRVPNRRQARSAALYSGGVYSEARSNRGAPAGDAALARHLLGPGLVELVSEVGRPLPLQLQVQELVVGHLRRWGGEEGRCCQSPARRPFLTPAGARIQGGFRDG